MAFVIAWTPEMIEALVSWRAAGASWYMTAEKIGVSPEACRRFARRRKMTMGRFNRGSTPGREVISQVRENHHDYQKIA